MISDLHVKDSAVVMGKNKIFGVKSAKRRKFFELIVEDNSGEIKCVWFRGDFMDF